MGFDIWDHEGNARAIYAEAKLDPEAPPGAHALARALLGRHAIDYTWRPLVGDGAYNPWGSRPRFMIRPGLTPMREAWVLYHEIAERHLYGQQDPYRERACDQLAAALRAPRRAFALAIDAVGIDLHELAGAFVSSELSAVMRVAEVTGHPLVLVDRSSGSVVMRGDEWEWGDVQRLAHARRLPDGVLRMPVRDWMGRSRKVAMFAEAA